MRHYVVVYQMGKVGSTSLINTINSVDGYEAVQSHFLSDRVLNLAFAKVRDPKITDHNYHHLSRQLLHNLDIRRRLAVGVGGDNRVTIISGVRDPWDWTRSAMIQDFTDYRTALLMLGDQRGSGSDAQRLVAGVERLMSGVAMLMSKSPEVEELNRFDDTVIAGALSIDPSQAWRVKPLLDLYARPHRWFFDDFVPTLGVTLDDIQPASDGLFRVKSEGMPVFIYQYEKMQEAIPALLDEIGLGDQKLKRDNISENKIAAEEISRVFRAERFAPLRSRTRDSRYARTFGYV